MKQEKIWDNTMTEITDASRCVCDGDLVAFLYGETTETEARDFQVHLDACAACRSDLSAFGVVRTDIGVWRNEALHPEHAMTVNLSAQRNTSKTLTNRSALVALREFFTLSPMWLRGLTAFASVLFVTLLIVTAMQFFERSKTTVVQQTPPAGANRTVGLPSVVAKDDVPATLPSRESAPGTITLSPSNRTRANNTRVALRTKPIRRAKAPDLSDEERSELSDLLIAAKEDEEGVPRLDDLLTESN